MNISDLSRSINIRDLEQERKDAEAANQATTSWIQGGTEHRLVEDTELGEKITFSLFAKIAGNGQVPNDTSEDGDLVDYLSTYFRAFCDGALDQMSDFSDDIKKKIKSFSAELNAVKENTNKETCLRKLNDGPILIPVRKKGGSFFIRIEKGVGVKLFDANLVSVEMKNEKFDIDVSQYFMLEQGQNKLTKDLQQDIKLPCELTFNASKKEFDDEFFTILFEAIENNDHGKIRIISLLESELETEPKVQDLEDATYKKGVRSSLCSEMKSLSFAFQSALIGTNGDASAGLHAYKVMMFFLQLQSLVDVWEKEKGALTKKQLTLFEEIIANLARRAEKLRLNEVFKENDTNSFLSTIRDIECQINEKRKSLKSVVTKGVAVQPVEQSLTNEVFVSSPDTDPIDPQGTYKYYSYVNTTPLFDANYLNKLEPHSASKQLKELLQNINTYTYTPSFQANFKKFMETFPSPSKESDSFWKQIPEDERVATMATLNELIISVHKVSVNCYNGSRSEDLVMYHQFLGAIDELARIDLKEIIQPDDKICVIQFLKTIRSPHFYLEAPFQKKLNELMSYFLNETSDETYALFKEKEAHAWADKEEKLIEKSLFGLILKSSIPTVQDIGHDATLKLYERYINNASDDIKKISLEAVKNEKKKRGEQKLKGLNEDLLRYQSERVSLETTIQNGPQSLSDEKQKLISVKANRDALEKAFTQEQKKFSDLKRRLSALPRGDAQRSSLENEIKICLNMVTQAETAYRASNKDVRDCEKTIAEFEKSMIKARKKIAEIDSYLIPNTKIEIEKWEKVIKEIGLLTFDKLKPIEKVMGTMVSLSKNYSPSLQIIQEAAMRATLACCNTYSQNTSNQEINFFIDYSFNEGVTVKTYSLRRNDSYFSYVKDSSSHLSHLEKRIAGRDTHLENYQIAPYDGDLLVVEDLPPKCFREFMEISTEYRGEGARLLAFCQKYKNEILDKPSLQNIIRIKFLRMNRLSNQLNEQPQFKQDLTEFILKGIDQFAQSHDVPKVLFLADLGSIVASFVDDSAFVLEVREKLLKSALPCAKNRKVDVLQAVLKLYPEVTAQLLQKGANISETFLIDITLYGILKAETVNFTDQNRFVDNGLEDFARSYIEKNKLTSNILNNVISIKLNQESKDTWKESFDTYTSTQYVYDFRVNSLKTTDGAKVQEFPFEITQEPLFKKLVGIKQYQTSVAPNGWHTVTNSEGESFQFCLKANILGVQKLVNNQWHALQQKNEVETLCQRYPSLLKDTMDFWRDEANSKIHVYDEETEVFTIDLVDEKVSSLTDLKTGDTVKPFSCYQTTLSDLTFLETDPLWIECRTNQGRLFVDLPRTELSFEKKDNKLYSKQYIGYWMVKNQVIEGVEGKKYILLENKEGHKKLVFPVQSAGEDEEVKSKRFTLSFIDGELKAEDEVLSQLYLAKIYYEKGQWLQGLRALKAVKEFNRFTKEELNLFKEVVQTIVGEGKNLLEVAALGGLPDHSLALTSLLKIIVIIEANYLRYSVSGSTHKAQRIDVMPKDLGIALYGLYLFRRSNIGSSALTPKEEKILIEFFDEIPLPNKFDQLKPILNYVKDAFLKDKKDFIDGKKVSKSRKVFHVPSSLLGLFTGSVKAPSFTIIGRKKIEEKILKSLSDTAESQLTLSQLQAVVNFDNYLIHDKDKTKEGFFDKHFVSYYRIATEGTEKDRKHLLKIIELNMHLESTDSKKYATILKSICLEPESFAQVDRIKNIHNDLKDVEEAKKKDDITAAEKIDLDKKIKHLKKRYKSVMSRISLGHFNSFLEAIKQIIIWAKAVFSGIGLVIKFISPPLFGRKITRGISSKVDVDLEISKPHKESMVSRDQAKEKRLAEMVEKHFETTQSFKSVADVSDTFKTGALTKYLEGEKKNTDVIYTITDENLDNLEELLCKKFNKHKERLAQEKVAFVTYLNGFFTDKDAKTKKLHLIGQREEFGYDDLQRLFLAGSAREILEKTAFSNERAEQVLTSFAEHLMCISRNQRLGRALDRINDYKSATTEDDKTECAKRIAEQLLEKRSSVKGHFDKVDRIQLSFECAQNLLYREDQVNKIRDIVEALKGHSDVLVEWKTGSGKTNLVTPDLTAKLSALGKQLKGEFLVVNIWPAASEMVNTRGLHKQRQKAVGEGVERFTFNRNSRFTVKSLEFMENELHLGMEKGIPLNMRPESIRALDLHHKYLLDECSNPKRTASEKETYLEQIEVLTRIDIFFRTRCVSIIDEQHVNLDPTDHMVYTSGRVKTIPDAYIEVVEELFKKLEKHEGTIQAKENKQCHLSKEQYKDISSNLADEMYQWLQDKAKADQPIDKNQFRSFVLDPLDKGISWVDKHHLREQICLVRGYLSCILQPTLKGSVDVSYGLSKLHLREKKEGDIVESDAKAYAIVYDGSDSAKENEITPSQFKVPEKTLAATYLTYLHKGVDEEQFIETIQLLIKEVKEDVLQNKPLTESQSHLLYVSLFDKDESIPVLTALEENVIKRLFKNKCRKNQLIYYFIKKIVLPKLFVYEETYTSTVQNMRSQFAKGVSLSATPLSEHAHAPYTKAILEETTAPRVTHQMLTKANQDVCVLESKNVFETLKEQAVKYPNIMGFFDVAAIFTGKSNQKIAECFADIYKDRPDISGVIFFDNKLEQFLILDKMTRQTTPFNSESHDPKAYFMFFDQNRCYGTNIVMPMKGEAWLSVGEETTKTLAGQGMGRLRQIDAGQSFHFVVENEVAQKIGTLSRETIVKYLDDNQDIETRQANFDAQKQQMDDLIRSAVSDTLLGFSAKKQVYYFKKYFRKQFVKDETIDSVVRYGSPSTAEEASVLLKAHYKAKLKEVDELNLSWNKKRELRKELKRLHSKFDKIHLPKEKIVGISDHTQDLQVQQHQEARNSIIIEEPSKEKVAYLTPWGHSVDPFTPGWEENLSAFSKGKNDKTASHKEIPLRKDCPIYQVKSVLRKYISEKFNGIEEFFDENLLVTNNFWQLKTQNKNEKPHELFSSGEKNLYAVLVIQDKGEKPKVMLIDQNDSEYFTREVLRNKKASVSGDRQVGIYDLSWNKMEYQGYDTFSDEYVKKDKEFISLVAQAKILSGRVNGYTQAELNAIEGIMSSKKINKSVFSSLIKGKFLKEGVRTKEEVQLFINSDLYKTIHKYDK